IEEGLEIFQPDSLRYALAANFPEQADTEISLEEIVRRINDELVANWGNLVNRVLSMTHKTCDGAVAEPGVYSEEDESLLAFVDRSLQETADLFESVELRAALRKGMEAAQAANRYLNATEPWKLSKTDPERAKTVLYVALSAINGIRVMLSPFLPFSSEKLDELLGKPEGWQRNQLLPGLPIPKPKPLFKKVETEK
ncbi:MAG: class I tRNA ligase family protein, partial [Actinomycetota bacterium]|nr:class I tRNA ligase family protein [Actinomycetota bacterium]